MENSTKLSATAFSLRQSVYNTLKAELEDNEEEVINIMGEDDYAEAFHHLLKVRAELREFGQLLKKYNM